jgi:hypothetical protein
MADSKIVWGYCKILVIAGNLAREADKADRRKTKNYQDFCTNKTKQLLILKVVCICKKASTSRYDVYSLVYILNILLLFILNLLNADYGESF